MERIAVMAMSPVGQTGVSGPLNVPYVAIADVYVPRHARPAISEGVRRHGVGGGTWPVMTDDRLDEFVIAMRGTAAA